MFKWLRRNEFTPYTVTDKVVFRNLDKTIPLTVRTDADTLVHNLNKVNKRLTTITAETPVPEQVEIAHDFAAGIFGTDQADKIVVFYGGDDEATAKNVIKVCGDYFSARLAKKITKAQKRK